MKTRAAFTLIEVLIGVLVLALGLLGLGAIIPVVVREQRQAADATLGVVCLNEAKRILLQRVDMNPDGLPDAGRVAWDIWIRDRSWSPGNPAANEPGRWALPKAAQFVSGDHVWSDMSAMPPTEMRLRVAQRLWPTRASQAVPSVPVGSDPYRPQFVWDFVARRAEFGDQYAKAASASQFIGRADVIQVAIFVRRIDQNIRLPRDQRLSAATLHELLSNYSRYKLWPVAVDPTTRMPTNNGVGDYAAPVLVNGTRILLEPACIDISGASASEKAMAFQPGQRVVDHYGNVYTVKGFDESRGAPTDPATGRLVLDRPIPAWVPGTDIQIAFVPQIPAAVEVLTIRRPAGAP